MGSKPHPIGALLREGLGYLAGQTGVMLLGFVSFPLFTRLLSRSDYGMLSLTNATLALFGLVVGLGLPNAIVRFLPEISSTGDSQRKLQFNVSQLAGAMAVAAAGALLAVAASWLVGPQAPFYRVLQLFRYVAVVLVTRAAVNILLEFFRMARRQNLYNFLNLAQKICNVGCACAGYLWLRGLPGLLAGMAVGEVLAMAIGMTLAFRCGYIAAVRPVWADFTQGVRFTFPMMLVSVCAAVMSYGDRYLVQIYLGAEAVASYSVAYDMCEYLQFLLTTSFRLSALPELVTRYTDHGPDQAAQFLAKAFRYFSWLLIGAGFGLVAVRKEAITLLASSKYAGAGALLPVLVPGVLLGGLNFMFASGLYLKKRNQQWLGIAVLAALLNIGLNIVLLPRIGLQGAAIATLVTYAFMAAGTFYVSSRYFPVRFNLHSLGRCLLCGLGMFAVLSLVDIWGAGLRALILKILFGFGVYCGLLIFFEKEVQQLVWGVYDRWKLAN